MSRAGDGIAGDATIAARPADATVAPAQPAKRDALATGDTIAAAPAKRDALATGETIAANRSTVRPERARADDSTMAPRIATDPTIGADLANGATVVPVDASTVGDGETRGVARMAELETLDVGVADMPSLPAVDGASYAVGVEIGRGGMGRILAARDRRLRRDVVMKIVRPDAASGRFQREALITARLQHPSIVRVYDAGWLDGIEPFYTMERVRGQTLDRIVADAKTPEARRALLPHVIAIADALAYAHSENIIHRDLKPANVLVGSFGETVVIDWGLAKDLKASDPSVSVERIPLRTSEMTMEGSVMGTPAYMPPEQARGEPADERSDVYAIGAILYTVLCGHPPVTGERALADVAAGNVPSLAKREPSVPAELISITERAMAFDPGERYASARELAQELRAYAAGQLVASHEYSTGALVRRWIARHRPAIAVALAALLAIGGLSAYGVRRIVAERDTADAARADAEQQRDEARQAHDKSERQHDDMLRHLAEADLANDPSRTLAWLARSSPRAIASAEAQDLAKRAAKLGLAFELTGPHDDVEHLALAGDILFSASDDGHVWRWHLGREMRGDDLGAHASAIECLSASRDGRWVASGGTDRAVWLWDAVAGTGRELTGHRGSVRAVEFSPDGTLLASTAEDGTLWLWDVATGKGHLAIEDTHHLRPVAWRPDGARLWVGTGDGRIREYDVASNKVVGEIKPHIGEMRWLALSPDGTRLASGSEDGKVKLWSVAPGTSPDVRELGGHADLVRQVLWTPDGKHVVSAGGDKVVRVYSPDGGKPKELRGNTTGIKRIAISRDGAYVASAGIDETVRVWSISGGAPRTLLGHRAAVKDVVFMPRGDAVVSSSEDDHIRVWPLAAPPAPPRGPDLAAWLAAQTNVQVAPP